MKITIEAEPKEIAALVKNLEGQPDIDMIDKGLAEKLKKQVEAFNQRAGF